MGAETAGDYADDTAEIDVEAVDSVGEGAYTEDGPVEIDVEPVDSIDPAPDYDEGPVEIPVEPVDSIDPDTDTDTYSDTDDAYAVPVRRDGASSPAVTADVEPRDDATDPLLELIYMIEEAEDEEQEQDGLGILDYLLPSRTTGSTAATTVQQDDETSDLGYVMEALTRDDQAATSATSAGYTPAATERTYTASATAAEPTLDQEAAVDIPVEATGEPAAPAGDGAPLPKVPSPMDPAYQGEMEPYDAATDPAADAGEAADTAAADGSETAD